MLHGPLGKKVQRDIRKSIIEDGLNEDQCFEQLEEFYDLDESDRKDIKEIISYYRNL